jgi:hypothetical protein
VLRNSIWTECLFPLPEHSQAKSAYFPLGNEANVEHSQRTFRDSLTLHKSANYDSAEGICRKIYQFTRDRRLPAGRVYADFPNINN